MTGFLLAKFQELNFDPELRLVSDGQIRKLAKALDLPVRATIAQLLEHNIWPLRFLRNQGILTAAQQGKLFNLKIFVAGVGGLGGYIVSLLARMGASRFRICDPDVFDESNLNRQRFCTEKTIGHSKAETARQGLMDIASYCEIEAHQTAVTPENLPGLLSDRELVIDCLDSVARKKMLETAATQAGIPYLHGSVLGQDGFIFLDLPGQERLDNLYPDIQGQNHTPGPNNVLATTVCGSAVLMLSLLITWLTGSHIQKLFHADFSVPELEILEI